MASFRSPRRLSRRFRRAFAIVSLLAGVFAASALATDYYSPIGYINNVGGHSYENRSVISQNSDNTTDAVAAQQTQNGNSVPAGYMGIDARAYHTNGALCEQSGYLYNQGPAVDEREIVWYLGTNCGRGYYYSDGASAIWTGKTYYIYNMYATIGIFAP